MRIGVFLFGGICVCQTGISAEAILLLYCADTVNASRAGIHYPAVHDAGFGKTSSTTVFALVYPGLVSAFGTFFLRQFYMCLPNDLMEAATLDGCNMFQCFLKVMMPLTKTAVMALAVFTALFAYSDMMWPLIVNMSIDKMTLAAGISSLQGQHATNYPVMMAAFSFGYHSHAATLLVLPKTVHRRYRAYRNQSVDRSLVLPSHNSLRHWALLPVNACRAFIWESSDGFLYTPSNPIMFYAILVSIFA